LKIGILFPKPTAGNSAEINVRSFVGAVISLKPSRVLTKGLD